MDAGAFSQDSVVKAAEGLVLILVDCTQRGANAELNKKYKVTGYPALVFTDSNGEKKETLSGAQGEAALLATFKKANKEYSRHAAWQKSVDSALELGKKETKPVLLFVGDPNSQLSILMQGFFVQDGAEKALTPFALARLELQKKKRSKKDKSAKDETLKKLKVTKGPMMLLLDPLAEDPLKKPLIKASSIKSFKKFKKQLEKAEKAWKKQQKKRAEEAAGEK